MRTLTRPMFNMGGPIKQGVMHGIREPHKHGGPTGTGLVGDQRYPKTDGREHHGIFLAPVAWTAARAAAMRMAPQALRGIKSLKNMFGKTSPGKSKQVYTGYSEYGPATYKTVTAPGKFTPNWLGRDPLVKTIAGAGKAIFNPTTGGWVSKGARFATSPSSIVAGVAYYMWPDGKERTEPPKTGGGVPGGGDPGMKYTAPGNEVKVLSQAAKDAFAKSQREKRVQKYLDMMGYDQSKKTAIADALIDASKIVGDRGSLEAKNITQELINPIIQATSKRLDKPQQIREAVGLMSAKAEIEKDLSKEKDALKTELTELQIEGAKETLKGSRSFEGGLSKFISERKGKVDKVTLERISRLLANEHNEPFIKTEEGTVASGDGIYMIDGGIFRVTDGVEKQLA